MTYATEADIQLAAGGAERFTALTDWNEDQAIDADVVARALAAADAYVNGYLWLRYKTIANPTQVLVELAAAEAIYWLRDKRQMASVDDHNDRKYRDEQMRLMQKGIIRPDDPAPAASSAVASAMVDADEAVCSITPQIGRFF